MKLFFSDSQKSIIHYDSFKKKCQVVLKDIVTLKIVLYLLIISKIEFKIKSSSNAFLNFFSGEM